MANKDKKYIHECAVIIYSALCQSQFWGFTAKQQNGSMLLLVIQVWPPHKLFEMLFTPQYLLSFKMFTCIYLFK